MEVRDGVVLAIHGGAGTILRERMTPELDREYRKAIAGALLAGHAGPRRRAVARGGGRRRDPPLEDSPLFNAGRGAVLNDDGAVELDASIMDGRSGMAGAVAGVTRARHPIEAAARVMTETEHVLLAGRGADRFIAEQGLELAEPEWFVTPHRELQLRQLQARDLSQVAPAGLPGSGHKFGTVGCVALDSAGHLAAGTSTGGMARKAWGRVGDSPVIGAGTWAADETCAVSCTGHGEFFIRKAIAHQIHARMLHGGAGIEQPPGGRPRGSARGRRLGGCVALGAEGAPRRAVHDPGDVPGLDRRGGQVTVRIHGDER